MQLNWVYLVVLVVTVSYSQFVECQDVPGIDGNSDNNQPSASFRKIHQCQISQNQISFSVLPGYGWDNLENVDKAQIYNISYRNCRFSPDGTFLIPENIDFHPNRKSTVRLDSSLYSHFSNYTSSTAQSLNVDANYATPTYSISGSFSWEHKTVKEKQIRDKSTISKIEMRYNFFTLQFQPDSALDSQFRNRVLDIGASLLQKSGDDLYPQYLAQILIRDFGTHIVRGVDAGALLKKVDLLKESYINDMKGDTTAIRTTASYSMGKKLNVSIGYTNSKSNSQIDEYNKNCASTTIETMGGKPYGSDFALKDWEKDLQKNLVAVDRRGEPLNYVVTPRAFPEIDVKTVFEIGKLIEKAIDAYYTANTRVGCMDIRSPNFNDDANVDSGKCAPPKVTFSLGGVFQSCSGDSLLCRSVYQTNPATGGLSCAKNYRPILLQRGLWKCRRSCSFLIFNCKTHCAYYNLYWCSPDTSKGRTFSDGGYLFGGFYTNVLSNPVTKSYTCPSYYLPIKFGSAAVICISSDSENGIKSDLKFGGFFSCDSGNPLADIKMTREEYWPKGCADGYSEHLLVIDRGCQLSYCVKATEISSKVDPPLLRPPFIDLNYGPNITSLSSFTTEEGDSFIINDNGDWKKSSTLEKVTGLSSSVGKIVGFSFLGSILIATAVLGIIFGVHRYKARKENMKTDEERLSTDDCSTNQAYDGSEENTNRKTTTTILLPPTHRG